MPRQTACVICGAETSVPLGMMFVCIDCKRHKPDFDRAFIATRLTEPIREIVIDFKYRRAPYLVRDLTDILHFAFMSQAIDRLGITKIVPVPMTRKKAAKRGYNQAELLAAELAKRTKIPLDRSLLIRKRTKNETQTRLGREARFKNAVKGYSLGKNKNLKNETVLLVDDIMTTGATLNACANHLKKAGAEKVYSLTIARGSFHG